MSEYSWQMAQVNGPDDDKPEKPITHDEAINAHGLLVDAVNDYLSDREIEALELLWDYINQLEEHIYVMTPEPEPPSDEDEVPHAMSQEIEY